MDPLNSMAPALLLTGIPANAETTGGGSLVADDGEAHSNITVSGVEYPAELHPFNYSDVLVLINNNSAMSRQVGEYFVQTRDVPAKNVAYLDVPAREVISKDQFEDLKEKVKDHITYKDLVDEVNYIVTTKGFPLKISNASNWFRACVDEELALIFGPLESRIGNSFYVANPYAGERSYFSAADQGIYLVNRLTGYDWDDVRGIIDRANDTMGNRGKFVLDVDPGRDGSPGYRIANDWLRNANTILVDRGEDVFFDDSRWYVVGKDDVMGYASWGSNDGNDTDHAKPHNTWVNGSIAETFVSTGGRTFTYPPRYGQSMIADIIRENVTGVKGYVYEPYLTAIAHPDILFERYTAGFNLAQSYRMASLMLGWMGVVVGDPKCAPYRDIPDLYIDDSLLTPSNLTPATGDPMTLRVMVKNLGGAAQNTTVDLYVDGELWVRQNVTFDTFSLTTIDIAIDAPITVGEHTLLVLLNLGPAQFFETLYDNNRGETTVTAMERPVVSLQASSLEVDTFDSVFFEVLVVSGPRTVTRFYFDFGDGSHVLSQASNTSIHSYDQDGVYTVTAWVLDDAMVLSYQASLDIRVANRAPSAIISVEPSEALTWEEFSFNATRSSDMDGEVVSATWDMGDGNTSEGMEVTHAYAAPGDYIVRVTVTDDDGLNTSVTRRVTVLNQPPTAIFRLEDGELMKRRLATFNASESSDIDGRIHRYEWSFGDGTSGDITTSPWTVHTFDKAGNFTVTLTVVDELGGAATAELEVSVATLPPVADLRLDQATILTDVTVSLDASWSYDPDGDLQRRPALGLHRRGRHHGGDLDHLQTHR